LQDPPRKQETPTSPKVQADESDEVGKASVGIRGKIGAILGPGLFLLILLIPTPAGLDPAAWRTLGVVAWVATWWVTEPVPLPVTALLPLILIPLLGILPIATSAAPYANPLIFLFLGGFLIALALQNVNLHRRIALAILGRVGASPAAIVAGFMVAAAFLSMWVSNTATVLMMLPIGISVIELANKGTTTKPLHSARFAIVLMLSLAYAASIGGLATLIGTPPNALMAAFMADTYDIQIGFATWMLIGVPIVLIALPITWFLLTRIVYPLQRGQITGWQQIVQRERGQLGAMTSGERRVAAVFAIVALLWMTQPLLATWLPLTLTDTTIALIGAVTLFLLPRGDGQGGPILAWNDTKRLPWGVLLLFGGGLSLAEAMQQSGLSQTIGDLLVVLDPYPFLIIIIAVTTITIFLTELTSNTATAATFIPIVAALAITLGHDPLLLAVPAALAASAAFMLPVATPPNAIVYASGHIKVPQMIRAGILLNIMAIIVLTTITYLLVEAVFAG
jgi:solute carrier family 13 (sodium-dependent dicarboxylate transporter), member 2/3/5